jgi:hypothetical protein
MKTWRPEEGDDFDTAIDAAWRKASREEPRLHVDAAILAAARTRRPWFATWQPLAAAAAVAGLAFLLVQLLPRERELEQPIRMESQRPAALPAEQPGVSAKATMQGSTEPAAIAPRVRENEVRKLDQPVPGSALALPQESVEAGESLSDAAPGPRQLSKESRAGGELAAGAPAPAAAAERATARAESSSLAAPTAQMPPAQWATLIETLYASGDQPAAAAQLRAFRTEHADADRYLPESLREWASAVE